MTTDWRETVPCLNCGAPTSTEQPIKSWIRKHEDLDSRQQCLCIGDSDLWVQRYGTRRHQSGVDRDVMYIMLVEVKTNARGIDQSQRDLLHIVNQLLRTNPWREQRERGRFKPGHKQNVRIVYSIIAGRKVRVQCYGVHLLCISGQTPDASDWIMWDNKSISFGQLVDLLRYELHPDSLLPMEHRSHKQSVPMAPLFDLADLNGGD